MAGEINQRAPKLLNITKIGLLALILMVGISGYLLARGEYVLVAIGMVAGIIAALAEKYRKPDIEPEIKPYQTLEMPLLTKAIRMELPELKRFCNDQQLPLFTLRVEETIHNGFPLRNQKPYRKYYTLDNGWVYHAAVPLTQEELKEIEGVKA
jgi:hypothetical protein